MNQMDAIAIDGLLASYKKQVKDAKTLPTAIYARKSTKDESQVSIQGQVECCTKLIENDARLNLYREYKEDNISGYHMDNRKELLELLDDVDKGLIKVVYTYALDRLSRNVADSIKIEERIKSAGAYILYATQSFEDNADGEFTKNIMRALAQRVPENTAEVVMRSEIQNAKLLKSNGGVALFGYKVVNKVYVKNDDEADIVKKVFKLALTNISISEIAKEINKLGFRNRKGNEFATSSIHNMLTNEKYTGVYIYNKAGARKRKNRVLKKNYEEVRKENGIPQIIDKDTFNKVQEILSSDAPKTSTKAKEPYSLTGLLVCGCCGNKMHGYASIGGHSHKRYTKYVCRDAQKKKCKSTISQSDIEMATAKVLVEIIKNISSQDDIINMAWISAIKALKTEYNSANSRLPSLKKEQDNTIKALGNAETDDVKKATNNKLEILIKEIANLESRKKLLKSKLDDIKALQTKLKSTTMNANLILSNKYVFSALCKLFIVDITVNETNIVFNLVDFTK